jgi:hypothetical protein
MTFADLLVGHMHGGMGQVNVVLSTLMGGVSGSANAMTISTHALQDDFPVLHQRFTTLLWQIQQKSTNDCYYAV